MILIRDDGPMRSSHLPPYKGSGMGQQMVRTLVQSDLHGEFDFVIIAGWAESRVVFRTQAEDEEEEPTL
jgi:hypothetical protein